MQDLFQSAPLRRSAFAADLIKPSSTGLTPGYEQKHFTADEKRGRLRLIASSNGVEGSMRVQQDTRLYTGSFNATERVELEVTKGRRAYVHVASGSIAVNETRLNAGDGVKITKTRALHSAERPRRRRVGVRSSGALSAG